MSGIELLSAAGMNLEIDPLVSIAVRIKYAPDRLKLFILSMQRQRYENWEVVAVTDGPWTIVVSGCLRLGCYWVGGGTHIDNVE
jgi:hypothetical protein